jgi:hypothetical protein
MADEFLFNSFTNCGALERNAVQAHRQKTKKVPSEAVPVRHTSRKGKTYYLHIGQKRGGIHYFFSTKHTGSLAESVPDGFEIYESVRGQVFLRRTVPKLIHDEETACIQRHLEKLPSDNLYKVETRGDTLTIFESSGDSDALSFLVPAFSLRDAAATRELRERFATYQAVMRFVLMDPEQRLFAPQRYCFRGQVDDWISVGPPEPIKKLAAKYVKHLGRDSFFELY